MSLRLYTLISWSTFTCSFTLRTLNPIWSKYSLTLTFRHRVTNNMHSIVFVHELNPKGDSEHARKTWTHENDTFWSTELLSELLPIAWVLFFAYNSSVFSNVFNVSVVNHAQSLLNDVKNRRLKAMKIHRPLIFVTHSLRDLLVKQVLIEARLNERKYDCLKTSTYELIFFATSHASGNRYVLWEINFFFEYSLESYICSISRCDTAWVCWHQELQQSWCCKCCF